MSYNFIKKKTEKKNQRIKRWFNIAQAYEDTTNFEAVPNISKPATSYGKVDGKDNSVILGTLWGWTTWSRRIKKLKFFDDFTTASTFTKRKRVMPDEITRQRKYEILCKSEDIFKGKVKQSIGNFSDTLLNLHLYKNGVFEDPNNPNNAKQKA